MAFSDVVRRPAGCNTEREQFQAFVTWIESQGGAKVIKKFHDRGLGYVVASWTGDGNQQQLSVSQMIAVFGAPSVQELADKTGLDLQAVSLLITKALPVIVTHQASGDDVQMNKPLLREKISLLKSKLLG
ncbi:Uncharacterized protein conserved in bacteria [Klebsiella pneumoniae]|nr:Uncharacterized protein conserved in bacteria [Klebsiella pneumoniae]